MNPTPNFFLTNRSFLEHPWLTKNRFWQLAWVYIVGRADYLTGIVCLTDVYKEVKDMFPTHSKWRHFINQCVKRDMLSEPESENMGENSGFRQLSRVLNYEKYQGEFLEKQRSALAKSRRANAEQAQSPMPIDTRETGVSAQSQRSESAEHSEKSAVYIKEFPYKEVLKEVKEKEVVEVAEYLVTKPPHQKATTTRKVILPVIRSALKSCWIRLEQDSYWKDRLAAWQGLSEEAQANAYAKAQALSGGGLSFSTYLINCLDEAASFHKPQTEKGSAGAGPGLEPGIEHSPNRQARDNWINEMWDEDYHRAISTGKAHDEAADYADAMRQDRLNSKYEPSPPKTMDEAHQAWMKQPTPGAREVRA